MESSEALLYLYLVADGCFGGRQVATIDGKLVLTRTPGKHSPHVVAGKHFLETNEYVIIDDL